MVIDVWVPVLVALIAAVPATLGVLYGRRTASTPSTGPSTEMTLTVNGLMALVEELQEERSDCRHRLAECLRSQREVTHAVLGTRSEQTT